MTNKNKKTAAIMLGIMIFGIFVMSLNFASAEYKACLKEGDKYTYCTHQADIQLSNCNPSYCTCQKTLCTPCFKSYDPVNKCYVGGDSSECLKMPTTCSSTNGTGTGGQLDLTPPVFNVSSPIKNTIYNTKKIFLNISTNEMADIYYRDLNKSTSTISFTKVCDNCPAGMKSYAKVRSFKEGNNSLIFKAIDMKGNEAYFNVYFFIDSTKPRIYSTYPKANAFADGTFQVQFKELNPKKATLYYGTDKASVDLSKCYDALGKKNCEIEVNLNKYHGQVIGYYFEVEDIAGNTYTSRSTNVLVDTKAPILNNPTSFYKIVDKRYVEFNLSIKEENLYKVTLQNTLIPRSTGTTMCTKLTNGYCYKKVAYTEGNYSLSIQITDKAGQSIAVPATFKIDY